MQHSDSLRLDKYLDKGSSNQALPQPTVGLIHSYDLIDDFLDSINISFETFCREFVGSWTFGYIDALKQAGVRTVLFCISNQVKKPSRFVHQPTGATICVLPSPKIYCVYRKVRHKLLNFYGAETAQSFKDIQDDNRIRRFFLTSVKDILKSFGSYLATPLNLLAQELSRENCQAILCQEYEYSRFDACVLLGRSIGLRVFATFQGGDQTQSWLEALARKISLSACEGVIIAAQSEAQRVQTRYQLSSKKIFRIFNPVDLTSWQAENQQTARAELGIPLNARVVVWHGRVEINRKGLDVLLEAWHEIVTKQSGFERRLILLGTGSEADQLQERIAALKLQGITWINEFIDDRNLICRYLSAADVYAFPSRQEGFPVAPLEAMACGLPVVAAAASGVPDIFEEGIDSGGIVVPCGNATALAAGIQKILVDEAFAKKLGQCAYLRAKNCFLSNAIGYQLRMTLLGF
jgi:glycosyltransferase involved in cell wall biosynthesis